jgi:hypothetical protein
MYLLGTELEIAKRVNTFHTLVMLEQVFWLLFCRNEGDSEKHIFCGFLMWKNKTCCLNVNEFLRYWNLNSGPIPWATSPALFFFFFFVGFFFEIRSHELFAWVGFEPWSFWSLPRVARITGMHHGFLAVLVLVKGASWLVWLPRPPLSLHSGACERKRAEAPSVHCLSGPILLMLDNRNFAGLGVFASAMRKSVSHTPKGQVHGRAKGWLRQQFDSVVKDPGTMRALPPLLSAGSRLYLTPSRQLSEINSTHFKFSSSLEFV